MNFYEKLRELNCQRNRLFRIIKRKISPLNIIQYFYRSSPDYDLKHVKKILLIRNDLISDMVFTTGLIRNLAQAGYEIYVSSRPNALEIIKHNPYVQGTFAFDDSSWCNFYHFMKQICQHQFDLAIELRPNFPFYKKKSHWFYVLLPSPILLGLNRPADTIFNATFTYTNLHLHVTELMKAFQQYLNVQQNDLHYEIFTSTTPFSPTNTERTVCDF